MVPGAPVLGSLHGCPEEGLTIIPRNEDTGWRHHRAGWTGQTEAWGAAAPVPVTGRPVLIAVPPAPPLPKARSLAFRASQPLAQLGPRWPGTLEATSDLTTTPRSGPSSRMWTGGLQELGICPPSPKHHDQPVRLPHPLKCRGLDRASGPGSGVRLGVGQPQARVQARGGLEFWKEGIGCF